MRYFLPLILTVAVAVSGKTFAGEPPIDRHALVSRHNVELHEFDARNPLTVGNGDFAVTVDATGLQTFNDAFTNSTPLGTLSDWGWHTSPNPNGWSPEQYHQKLFDVFGRKVPYNDQPGNKTTPESKWLRANPHRLDLGKIGLVLRKSDGTKATPNDISHIVQTLDLWNGRIVSDFEFDGSPVVVETICAPDRDAIAVKVSSPLISSGRIGIQIAFPYGTGETITADWNHPESHQTFWKQPSINQAEFLRTLDNDVYHVAATWSGHARLQSLAEHQFEITSANNRALEFVCAFAPTNLSADALPSFATIRNAAEKHWNTFWKTGGAIDLSGSTDPRWFELERRIVLSQYLTAIQNAGIYPPQETGLTYNSWEGKFHLEMHWWHEAHFALWNRLPLLEKSLGYYKNILPKAEATAKRQGYDGARWPKMTDPSGNDSPSPIGPFLIWQQPHPIFFAELCYRSNPDQATLKKYSAIVFKTAEFMASYPEFQTNQDRYVLGPVLQCSQEVFPKTNTLNPTFELTYWRWALETAQQWRSRLNQPRNTKWDDVLNHLSVPALEDGKYLFAETATGTYIDGKWIKDHPSVTAALGVLPGEKIDSEAMRRTLDWIWQHWDWPDTWGWDYPMLAMCAARLGEPDRAIDALFLDTPKNHYALNGHVYQRPGLTIYLPANGGLLYATAMMAAGWDGATNQNAPGFPKNGWHVRYENLKKAP